MPPFVHVAVDKSQLEGVAKCAPEVLPLLVALLEKLAPLANHPGLMQPKAIDSIGWYLDESRWEECNQRLVSGVGVQVVHKMRRFDVAFCEGWEKYTQAQRRQCVAVRGTNEIARRLDTHERGIAEILVTLPGGGTLSVRRHSTPRHMVVLLTSPQKKRRVLEADLPEEDAPLLAGLFDKAAKGEQQLAVAPSSNSRFIKFDSGSCYWSLPAWYSEAIARVAQDVFRAHVIVSAISTQVSRSIFIDRVTAHRLETGPIDTHRTLIKGSLHRVSGGCACGVHGKSAPNAPFKRLEFCVEFCGCPLVDGQCKRHFLAEGPTQSQRFPGVCMLCLKVEFRCAHEHSKTSRGGLRIPLDPCDEAMDLAFSHPFVMDVASCGARLMESGQPNRDLEPDMEATLAALDDARLAQACVGDQMQKRDEYAVNLLRSRTPITKKGRFAVGRVPPQCYPVLKTHKHFFRVSHG
jgi:hypothetical protein